MVSLRGDFHWIRMLYETGTVLAQGEVLKEQEQIYRDLGVTPLLASAQTVDA